MTGRRCLILGGGGFLGLATARALAETGAVATAFGRGQRPAGLDPRVDWRAGLYTDAAALGAAVRGQDIVFHLVGSVRPAESNQDPAGDVAANILPTLGLLDIARQAGVSRIVFASSGGTIYGVPDRVPITEDAPTHPITAYGISKLAIENYLGLYRHLHALDYRAIRIANAYGPGQSPLRSQGVVAALLHRALKGEALEIWGDGTVVRDFIHVDDVAAAFVHAAVHTGVPRVMNVGSGVGRSMTEVCRDVAATVPGGGSVLYRPGRPADVPVSVLDPSLMMRETGWRPQVAWSDGLAETAAWLKARY